MRSVIVHKWNSFIRTLKYTSKKKKNTNWLSYPHLISFGYTTSVNLRTYILINSRVQKQINSQYLFLMVWIVQFLIYFLWMAKPWMFWFSSYHSCERGTSYVLKVLNSPCIHLIREQILIIRLIPYFLF